MRIVERVSAVRLAVVEVLRRDECWVGVVHGTPLSARKSDMTPQRYNRAVPSGHTTNVVTPGHAFRSVRTDPAQQLEDVPVLFADDLGRTSTSGSDVVIAP